MVSGRSGGTPGHGGRRGSLDSESALRALGEEIDRAGPEGQVANEDGLRALGEEIDRAGGGGGVGTSQLAPPRPATPRTVKPPRRKRWSTKRKVVTTLVSVLVLALLLAAGGYAYLRYQWSQVTTVQCSSCVAAANGAPFNVLLVGSDSRAGNTGQAAQSFGSASQVTGQRSDTMKILHVDPATGGAQLLSIPRDTYVNLSGLPANSALTGPQKINSAFDSGPNSLIKTIENTFGIPISHFVIVNFAAVINTVDTLGGIRLNFNYPVRDNDNGNNNSGLNIPTTGCQTLNGNMTLALARSRYYQYYANGQWNSDPTSDIGRITRQNAIIEAIIRKAKSTYNPLTLNSFISAVVHDITVDQGMTFGDMYGLAERYHAFSSSSLTTYTLPTVGAQTPGGSDVLVVNEPAAQQTLQAFLGGASPSTPVTPPLDQNGNPISVPAVTPAPAPSSTAPSSSGTSTTPVTAPPDAKPDVTSYDPTPC